MLNKITSKSGLNATSYRKVVYPRNMVVVKDSEVLLGINGKRKKG